MTVDELVQQAQKKMLARSAAAGAVYSRGIEQALRLGLTTFECDDLLHKGQTIRWDLSDPRHVQAALKMLQHED